MTGRRLTTAITMVVLVVVLGAMAVFGFKAALAPLPGGSATDPSCSGTEKQVQRYLERSDVQVSVFNAGNRGGLAGRTLDKLERGGFRPGNVGNAPKSAQVRRAIVWTTKPNDSAARLVALALGRGTHVEVTKTDLGPGVDVLVGNKFKRLNKKAAKRVKLPAPVETCVRVD